MKLFFPKYPGLLKTLYPERISRIDNSEAIYLTFDDGPVPEVTPWVLDLLKEYHAKASFFCIGDNVRKHPEIFTRIISEDHLIGNHTYHHLNGWQTSNAEYLQNTLLADKIMTKTGDSKSDNLTYSTTPKYPLFRPPYGRIKNSQAKIIRNKGFKIVVWDVISGDYDHKISTEKCYKNVIRNAELGSSIVFHDSKKAFKNLQYTLPKVLEYYSEKGIEFRSLKDVLSANR